MKQQEHLPCRVCEKDTLHYYAGTTRVPNLKRTLYLYRCAKCGNGKHVTPERVVQQGGDAVA